MAIAQATEVLLHGAFVYSRRQRQLYVTVEHLLLGLLDEDGLGSIWKNLNVDTTLLRKEVSTFLDNNVPRSDESDEVDTEPSIGFQRVIQRAILRAGNSNNPTVNPIDILLAIFGEKDSHAVAFLARAGVSKDAIEAALSGKKPTAGGNTAKREVRADEAILAERIEAVRNALLIREGQKTPRGKVFISYSHADAGCLERLLIHLKPLERAKAIAYWSDQQIRVGDKWKTEIQKNLDDAAIAVLLISADFLASDFIVNNELPPLLLAADSKGIRILPVILKPSGFLRDPVLSSFQAINDPRIPLLGMSHIQQEEIYDKIAGEVSAEMQRRG